MTSLLVSLLLTLTILTGVVPGIFLLDAAASSRAAADNLLHFIGDEVARQQLDPRDITTIEAMPTDAVIAAVIGKQGLEGYATQIGRIDMTESGLTLVWTRIGTSEGIIAESYTLTTLTLDDFKNASLDAMTLGQSAIVVRIIFDPKSGDIYCGQDVCDIRRSLLL